MEATSHVFICLFVCLLSAFLSKTQGTLHSVGQYNQLNGTANKQCNGIWIAETKQKSGNGAEMKLMR